MFPASYLDTCYWLKRQDFFTLFCFLLGCGAHGMARSAFSSITGNAVTYLWG